MNHRGNAIMFVGYALDHPSGTYCFYKPESDSIVVSKYVKWKCFNRWEVSQQDQKLHKLFDCRTSLFTTKHLSDSNSNTKLVQGINSFTTKLVFKKKD